MPAVAFSRQAGQFSRFVIVGLLSTAINYGLFLILFRYAGLQYIVASCAGFLAGMLAGFQLNRRWTYQHEAAVDTRLASRYALVYGLSLIINAVLLDVLVRQIRLDPKLANLVTIGVTTCTNFVGTKLWVFQK